MATKNNTPLTVETLKHDDATRKNIPTAESQSVMDKDEQGWPCSGRTRWLVETKYR